MAFPCHFSAVHTPSEILLVCAEQRKSAQHTGRWCARLIVCNRLAGRKHGFAPLGRCWQKCRKRLFLPPSNATCTDRNQQTFRLNRLASEPWSESKFCMPKRHPFFFLYFVSATMFLAFYWAVFRHWNCLYWRQSADVQGPVAGQHPSNHACIVFDEIPTSSLDLPPTQRSCGRLVLVSCDKAPTISITHSFHTCRIQYQGFAQHIVPMSIWSYAERGNQISGAPGPNRETLDVTIDIIEFVSDKCRLKTSQNTSLAKQVQPAAYKYYSMFRVALFGTCCR